MLGSIAGAFVAVAGSSATLVRERWEFLLLAFLAAGAGFAWLAVGYASTLKGPEAATAQRRWRGVPPETLFGLILVVAGVLIAAWAAVSVQSLERRPNIDVSVTTDEAGGRRLTGSVSSGGLRAGDTVHVQVVGYSRPLEVSESEGATYKELTSAAIGAGADGTIETPLDVLIDSRYQTAFVRAWVGACDVVIASQGACARYELFESVELRPSLAASVEGTGDSAVLNIEVSAAYVGPDEALRLRVYSSEGVQYSAAWAPEADGSVKRTFPVAVGNYTNLCVMAAVLRGPEGDDAEDSPLQCGRAGSWVELELIPSPSDASSPLPATPSPPASAG